MSQASDLRSQAQVLTRAESFFESAVLFSLCDAGVIEHLSAGPAPLGELAEAISADPTVLQAVLDAAVAVGVLSADGPRYAAPDELCQWLGQPDDGLNPWLAFLSGVGQSMLTLRGQLARRRSPEAFTGVVTTAAAPDAVMSRAMGASMRSRGTELLDHLGDLGDGCFVDLGCGEGWLAEAALRRWSSARAILVDHAAPIEQARTILENAGVHDRAEFVAMDALDWAPAQPVDLIVASHMLHMVGDELAPRLLSQCAGHLVDGGRLVVQAHFLDESRQGPRWATLANLILVASTPAGRNHTRAQITGWMRDAGLTSVDALRLSLFNPASALVATRPTSNV